MIWFLIGILILCLLSTSASAQTTIKRQVALGSDDAEENTITGEVTLTSPDIEMIYDSGITQVVGYRFTNLTIPQGARILSAYMQFTASAANSATTTMLIRGQAADNPGTFTTATNDISSRPVTTTVMAWNKIPAWTTIGERAANQRTPGLINLVQELVDRPTWASGNSMVFIMSGSGVRTAESIEGNPLQVAELTVTYNTGVTYTTIDNGDWDDPDIWSIDGGVTSCNCSPPDKIENGTTVLLKHDVYVDSDLTILIENGGSLSLSSARLDMEQNLDVKPGGFFNTSNSYIYSSNGNINNEGTFLHKNSCVFLDNGSFKNVSGLNGDGNEGMVGNGYIYLLNGDIQNSGFWDVNISWCALNGNSDLPPGDEDCTGTASSCDPLTLQANLQLDKDAPALINNGQVLTYTITVTNNGPDEAENVLVNDAVPAQVTNPEFSIDGGLNWLPWSGSYFYSELIRNEIQTLLIRGVVSGTTGETFTNSAFVFSDSRDINYNDNLDAASTTIPADFDNDGILDQDDVDDDNDGILDTVESGGIDPDGDLDSDGVPNFRDADFCSLNTFLICASLDVDNDGLPNHLDLDSDADLCNDVVEAGYTDQNGDGLLADLPTTVDAFGRVTGTNQIDGYTAPEDADSNGIIDAYQSGSDPVIVTHPSNTSVMVNNSAQFYVTSTNSDTFQWQISTDGGINFTNLAEAAPYSGTNLANLTIDPVTLNMNGYEYRVIVQNNSYKCSNPITSNAARLTVTGVTNIITNRRITHRVNKD